MLWWFSVCERAREAVMYASVYSVLTDEWPGARCSNYHGANYDADLFAPVAPVTATTTWFPDKHFWNAYLDPADPDSWDPAQNPPHLTQEFPRAFFDSLASPYLMEASGVSDRLLMRRRTTRAQIDAPELYQMNQEQWLGNSQQGKKGHWGLNPYVPAALQYPQLASYLGADATFGYWTPQQETIAQMRLRMQRHDVESIINAGEGGHETTLGPWLNQFISVNYDEIEQRAGEREMRMLLAMLRGKNVPYIKWWFTKVVGDIYPAEAEWKAFRDTRDLVRRVWATDIESVQAVVGGILCDEPCDELPAALEYTLRDSLGYDVTIPLVANWNSALSELEVIIRIPEQYAGDHDFEINLEALCPQGMTGTLLAKNASNDQWVVVDTMEGTSTYAPDFSYIPIAEFANVRRTFWLKGNDTDLRFVYASGTSDGYMVLRIKHDLAYQGGESRIDLLQVIPILQVSDGLQEEAESVAVADINADRSVDGSDLTLFVEGFNRGTNISDMNSDCALDQTDIDTFIRAYNGG